MPSSVIAQFVVSLMAFRHWTAMPTDQRAKEEVNSRKLVDISRFEYQKASRFLITSALNDKFITLEQAAFLSDCQHSTIDPIMAEVAPLISRPPSDSPDSIARIYSLSTTNSSAALSSDAWHKKVDEAVRLNRQFLESLNL